MSRGKPSTVEGDSRKTNPAVPSAVHPAVTTVGPRPPARPALGVAASRIPLSPFLPEDRFCSPQWLDDLSAVSSTWPEDPPRHAWRVMSGCDHRRACRGGMSWLPLISSYISDRTGYKTPFWTAFRRGEKGKVRVQLQVTRQGCNPPGLTGIQNITSTRLKTDLRNQNASFESLPARLDRRYTPRGEQPRESQARRMRGLDPFQYPE